MIYLPCAHDARVAERRLAGDEAHQSQAHDASPAARQHRGGQARRRLRRQRRG